MANSYGTYTDAEICEAILKRDYSGLGGVIEDDGVTGIRPYAFFSSTTAQTIKFPHATWIGRNAFYGCTATVVDLPWEDIVTIEEYAFYAASSASANATRHRSISLDSLESVGEHAFGSGSSNYVADVPLEEVSAAALTSMAVGLFQNNGSIQRVSLPSVLAISDEAFKGCKALLEVTAPEALSIAASAFNNAESLEEAVFPKVETIGQAAFSRCTGLTRASFAACQTLDSNVFSGCTVLAEVSFPVLSTVGQNAFENCPALTQISLPGVTVLPMYLFRGSTGLKKVKLSGQLTTIAAQVFYNCSSLDTLILDGITSVPAIANANAFQNTPIQAGTGYIYVPDALKSKFETANRWSNFAGCYRSCEDYPQIVNSL